MLADQGQLLLLLGQLAQNVLDEVVRGDGSQVPLQLAQHHQLPLLRRVGGKALKIRRLARSGLGAGFQACFNDSRLRLSCQIKIMGGGGGEFICRLAPHALKSLTALLVLKMSGSAEDNERAGNCCQDPKFLKFLPIPYPHPQDPDAHKMLLPAHLETWTKSRSLWHCGDSLLAMSLP